MPDYVITVPPVWDTELQREVQRRNRARAQDDPTWTPVMVLRDWCKQQLEPMVRASVEARWSRRKQAWETAPPATSQQVDTLLGVAPDQATQAARKAKTAKAKR